ncbi:MAG: glycosyltransferase [Pseudomonadota bacterium]
MRPRCARDGFDERAAMLTALRSWTSRGFELGAEFWVRLGRWRTAALHRRIATRVAPWRPRAWVRHALSLRRGGRRAAGLACLRRAERLLAETPPKPDAAPERFAARARDWAAYARAARLFGKPSWARAAFLRAQQLDPTNANLWTDYADLLRALEEPAAEIAARRRAAEADDAPKRVRALAEAEAVAGREASAAETLADAALADPPPAPPARPAGGAEALTIALDLTDLVEFLRHNPAVSGIQRVQAELARALLAPAAKGGPARGRRIRAALHRPELGGWRLVSNRAVLAAIEAARQGGVARRRAAEAVAGADEGALDQCARPILFTPGAVWRDARLHRDVQAAKRRAGLIYIPFVHDCVPLILPETCPPHVPAEYGRWLAGAATLADGFLANSERTAADLAETRARIGGRPTPIEPVRLDARAAIAPRPKRPPLDPRLAAALSERGFALTVGSIEPRKNHALLFDAWEALTRRFGARTPVLLVVGRLGWREERILDDLDDREPLQGSVALLHDLSDAELAWCYARARFSVVASRYEGWGLPVTESLSAGLPPLVARNSALIEAGGGSATFFETDDPADLLAKLETFTLDDRALAAARKTAAAAPLRDWSAVAADVLAALDRVAASAVSSGNAAVAPALGASVDFGARAFGRDLAVQEAAIHGAGWIGREPGAWWLRGGVAAGLTVGGLVPGERLRLTLEAGSAGAAVAVSVTDQAIGADAPSRSAETVDIAARRLDPDAVETLEIVCPAALCEIALKAEGPSDRRAVGLRSIERVAAAADAGPTPERSALESTRSGA